MILNKDQKSAVEHRNGPLLIIAGAGTGKTKVLTERIAYIIKKKWAKPEQILALTFTEKAAGEMQERLDLILPLGHEQPHVATFHSFADSILRQEGIYIGIDSSYTLMTQAQSYMLFRKYLYDLPLSKFRPNGNPTSFISAIVKHFSRLLDEDVTPSQYLQFAKSLPKSNESEKEYREEILELAKVFNECTKIKYSESMLDFGDLIVLVLKIFREKNNILQRYHRKYKYILVDEYQDTNYTQNVLVNLLALGGPESQATDATRDQSNITVVGDDDQAIYKFRGAAISNILQFRQIYPNAKSVVLTENYRSNQSILNASYSLIKNNNPYRLEVTEKIDKRLKAQNPGSDSDVVLIRTNDGALEAETVAGEILKLVGRGEEVNIEYDIAGQGKFSSEQGQYSYKDIAILARSNSHIEEIVDTLRYREIPFKLNGNRSLYARPEIVILISYLKSLLDYSDSVAFFNVLSMKEWGYAPKDVIDLHRKAKRLNISVYELLEQIVDGVVDNFMSESGIEGSRKLVDIYRNGQKQVLDKRSAGDILFKFFEGCGLKDNYLNELGGEHQLKVENTKKYFDMLKEYWSNNKGATIYEYMDYLKYSLEIGESPTVDADSFDDMDAVNISTIHSSKGLEFPVVFVINMVSDRFPSRDRADVIPIPPQLIKEVLPSTVDESEHIMEERRLAYVALTRAKEKLYLTASDYYALGKRKKRISPFIYEALGEERVTDFVRKRENPNEIVIHESSDNFDYVKYKIKPQVKFSYSQIHAFEVCPLQYKYDYVLNIPTLPSATLSFGSTVHNVLNQLYRQHQVAKEGLGIYPFPTVKDALELLSKNWINIGYESKKQEKLRYKQGEEVVGQYMKKLYNESENILALEKNFEAAISDFVLVGRIDRIDLLSVENGINCVEIIDYKTGKFKDEKEVAKEWQLQLYAYIVEKVMNMKVVKASYIYLEAGKKVEVKLSSKKQEKILQNVIDIVGRIRKGDFTVDPSHDCKYCKYKEICEGAII